MSSHTNVFTYDGTTVQVYTPTVEVWDIIAVLRDDNRPDVTLHLTREVAETLRDELDDALSVGPDDGSDDLNDRLKGK